MFPVQRKMPLLLFMCCFIQEAACKDTPVQKADPGDDVTLVCKSPPNFTAIAVQWRRSGLDPPQYVFYLRDRRSDETYQNESFKNRVELSYQWVKNGNLSLLLKNVTQNDNGMYQCWGYAKGHDNMPTVPINTTSLEVRRSGRMKKRDEDAAEEPAGSRHDAWVAVGALAVAAAAVVVVILKIQRASQQPRNDDHPQSESEEIEMEQLNINQVSSSSSSSSSCLLG